MEMDSGKLVEVVRKLCFTIRSLVYALRKNLHLLLKRTKSFPNLLLHHYFSSFACLPGHHDSLSFISPSSLREVEFSCSNTPVNNHPFSFKKRSSSSSSVHRHGDHHRKHAFHVRGRIGFGKKYNSNEAATIAAVQRVLEILNLTGGVGEGGARSVMASPMVLPGFGGGKSPAPVRQLRITDSPFPLKEEDAGDGGQVDMRAEEFIRNFYRDRREEKCMSPYYYGLWG